MKKTFCLLLVLLMAIVARGYDVVVDGIYYNLDADTQEAEVTYGDASYMCDMLVVPTSIIWDGVQYNVRRIGERAFFNDSALRTVILPASVTDIRAWAFGYCDNLSSVSLGNEVMTIGEEAFVMCRNLTALSLPNSVSVIDYDAFCGCSLLRELSIPSSLTEIRDGVFCGCESLTDIIIPNTVTSIGDRSFSRCSNLHFVNIGSGVRRIKMRAFEECVSLDTVYYHAREVPETAEDIFRCSTFGLAKLFVPNSSIDSYKASEPWCDFYEVLPLSETGIAQISAPQLKIEVDGGNIRVIGLDENEPITIYDLGGHLIDQTMCRNGSASVATHQPDGAIVIVKIRERAVQIVVRD